MSAYLTIYEIILLCQMWKTFHLDMKSWHTRGRRLLILIQYRKFLLQHTDSYPTQHQWVITQSFDASDCLIISNSGSGLIVNCNGSIGREMAFPRRPAYLSMQEDPATRISGIVWAAHQCLCASNAKGLRLWLYHLVCFPQIRLTYAIISSYTLLLYISLSNCVFYEDL